MGYKSTEEDASKSTKRYLDELNKVWNEFSFRNINLVNEFIMKKINLKSSFIKITGKKKLVDRDSKDEKTTHRKLLDKKLAKRRDRPEK